MGCQWCEHSDITFIPFEITSSLTIDLFANTVRLGGSLNLPFRSSSTYILAILLGVSVEFGSSESIFKMPCISLNFTSSSSLILLCSSIDNGLLPLASKTSFINSLLICLPKLRQQYVLQLELFLQENQHPYSDAYGLTLKQPYL